MATATNPDMAPMGRRTRFMEGALERWAGNFSDVSRTLSTASQTLDLQPMAAGDFTAAIPIEIRGTTSGNSANVAYVADAPFSVVQQIELLDPTGKAFWVLQGWELYAAILMSGYLGQGDVTLDTTTYAATTGTGGTGGSFRFILWLHPEILKRDGVGVLYNGSTAAQFQVRITLAPSTAVYSTAPTTQPVVNVRFNQCGYVLRDMAPAAPQEPPGGAIYQAWNRQVFQFTGAGQLTLPVQRKGYWERQVIFICRNSSGVRIDSLITDIEYKVDNVSHFNGSWDLLKHVTFTRAGRVPPVGLAQVSYISDFDGLNGGETRDMWVKTEAGSIKDLRVTVTGAGSLTVLTNDVSVPADGKAIAEGVVKVPA
jgi:hypothetical protein